MSTTPTVYFDSNFFVWLARADDEGAENAIEQLNSLSVRPVVSPPLIEELGSYVGTDERTAKLLARLGRLEQPLALSRSRWADLSRSRPEREAASAIHRAFQPLMAKAHATAAFARQLSEDPNSLSKQQMETVRRTSTPEEMELFARRPEEIPPDERERLARPRLDQSVALLDMVAKANPGLLSKVGVENIRRKTSEVRANITEQGLEELSQLFLTLVGAELPRLETESDLTHYATRRDNRIHSVVRGDASAKTTSKLGHTFRDSAHGALFRVNSDQIDLLQLDRPFFNSMRQGGSDHPFATLNLLDRVFTASNLKDAVDKVCNILTRS